MIAVLLDACFSEQQMVQPEAGEVGEEEDRNPAITDVPPAEDQPQSASERAPAPASIPAPCTPTATPTKVSKQRKRTSPGIRILRGRIYDPENGKSCHQCRQKTMDFVAECTNLKQENKVCTMKFCHKCLINRYGEKAEEVVAQGGWRCPKCRGICNCSFCMKKKGYRPTGILAHKAKATGFTSVSEWLQVEGPAIESLLKLSNGQDPPSVSICEKELVPNGSSSENAHPVLLHSSFGEKKPKKAKMEALYNGEAENKGNTSKEFGLPKKVPEEKVDNLALHVEVQLPRGSEVINVAGIDFPTKDVGNALQFLEFCAAFGEFFGLKEGQPESILLEIMGGKNGKNGTCSSAIEFHVQILTLLQKDLGEEPPSLSPTDGKKSWLHVMKTCICDSNCELKDMSLDCIDRGIDGYDMLDCSQKLKLLTFLCDETLGTMEIRNWIDDQTLKFAEKQREAKGKLAAAKDKEKEIKQKLQDEIAQSILAKNGEPLSIDKHETIVSEIKAEAERAQAEIDEASGLAPRRKQRSDVLRTAPVVLDTNGRAYWRLNAHSDLLLQDVGNGDLVAADDKWFSFDSKEKRAIEKYISSLRVRSRRQRRTNFDAPKINMDSDKRLGRSSDAELPPSTNTNGGTERTEVKLEHVFFD